MLKVGHVKAVSQTMSMGAFTDRRGRRLAPTRADSRQPAPTCAELSDLFDIYKGSLLDDYLDRV